MRRYILLISLFLTTFMALAQDSGMRVSAPNVVAVGEPFRVEFIINEAADNFEMPSFEGFELIAGPTMSSSQMITIINGKRQNTSEHTYTCVLIPISKGNKTIGAATAMVGNRKIVSRSTPIEVVGEGGGSQQSAQGGRSSASESKQSVSSSDMLLLMSADKRKVYKGEAIVVTLKLATRVELAGVESAKYPSFNGFWTQELEVPENTQWLRENINDKIYDTRILKKYLLFPQRSGALSVEVMSMDVVARIVTNSSAQRRSIFDDFFGGGASVQNVKRKVESKAISIDVLDLPTGAPASFDGAVGEFDIKSSLSNDMISANSSCNLIVTLSGSGNIPLLSEPKVSLPGSFETYKVKPIDQYQVSGAGAVGSKVFEYPFIARAAGKFDIPAIEFSYFSPVTKRYHTLSTKPLEIGVSVDTSSNTEQGSTKIYSGVTKEELKILGSDVKYIKTSYPNFVKKNSFFVLSFGYFAILIGLIVSVLFVFSMLKRRVKLNSDVVRVRSSKARKIALSRLKSAKVLMDGGQDTKFYQETLRAMWGYVSDKLNIELALLSKSNISDALSAKGVEIEMIEKYLNVVEQCEFAQYAPSGSSSMGDVYNQSVDVIINLEEKL